MAKGVQHTGNPDISPDEFPKADDGTHIVYGIDRWISKDDRDFPVFKDVRGQLKVLFSLASRGKDIGPVMALTAAELFALAASFGVTLQVPKNERTTTETLIRIKEAIKGSGKEIKVECNKGFANLPFTAQPPTGLYAIKYMGMERPDKEQDNLNFQSGEYGQNIILKWQIVGDVKGPCMYDGWELIWWGKNVFVDQYKIGDDIVNAEVLTFDRTSQGGIPKDAVRWYKFIENFAPGVFDHDWQRESLKSSFGVDEVKYPTYVINHYANQFGKPVMVWCKPNKEGRFTFDLYDGIGGEGTPVVESWLDRVVKYLVAAADVELFSKIDLPDILKTTDDGREWLRQYIAGDNGPWSRANLPDHNNILALTDEECERFMNELKKTFGESF